MAGSGYERNVDQCRYKWRALKQAFYSEREKRQRTRHHSAGLPPHYQAMYNIWKAAGRPVSSKRRVKELIKLRPMKRRSALATRSSSSSESPASSEDDLKEDTPRTLQLPQPQYGEDDAENSVRGKQVAGVARTPASMSCTNCFPFGTLLGRGSNLKQEVVEEKAGPSARSTLENIQQLLLQILHTSQQQQALLAKLARDSEVLSQRLMQVDDTVRQLLAQPHVHPGPLDQCIAHVPHFEDVPEMPSISGARCTSRP